MKKIFLPALIFLISLSLNSFSQSTTENRKDNSRDARRKLVFGFKGGFNSSNVYDQNKQNFVADSKIGGVAGGFLAIPFGDFIGFQPELLFSQKGFSGTGKVNGMSYALTRTTNHLDVPLQLQLKPFSWLAMLAGVQYSYLLSQRDDIGHDDNYEQINMEFNNDNIRKNLVGIVLGGDLNFWHIVVSGRTGWDIISNHGDGSSSTPRYKNLWVQATLGYRVY